MAVDLLAATVFVDLFALPLLSTHVHNRCCFMVEWHPQIPSQLNHLLDTC